MTTHSRTPASAKRRILRRLSPKIFILLAGIEYDDDEEEFEDDEDEEESDSVFTSDEKAATKPTTATVEATTSEQGQRADKQF